MIGDVRDILSTHSSGLFSNSEIRNQMKPNLLLCDDGSHNVECTHSVDSKGEIYDISSREADHCPIDLFHGELAVEF